jgi:hypothetical protein
VRDSPRGLAHFLSFEGWGSTGAPIRWVTPAFVLSNLAEGLAGVVAGSGADR